MAKAVEKEVPRIAGLAATAAEETWMDIKLSDCKEQRCLKFRESINSAGATTFSCIADGPRACPETRRRLWSLHKSIVRYYTVKGTKG